MIQAFLWRVEMNGKNHSFRDELISNAAEVDLGPEEFRPISDAPAVQVVAMVESHFGDSILMRKWGKDVPCDLPRATRRFVDGQGWAHLDRLAPDVDEEVWFVAENWNGDIPACFVFEAKPPTIRQILGNSHGFEYLVVSRRLDWLIAENHHDCLIAVGQEVVDRMSRIEE